MAEVEIAPWLKALPLAPEYHPTEAEFADPIAYILKVEEEARMYGVCKIIPPYSKASKKTVAFHLNRSLAVTRDSVSSSKMQGACPSMSRSMGGVMAGPQLVKQKSLSLDGLGTDSSGKAKFDTRRQQVGWNPKKTRGVTHSQTHKLVWESGEKYTLEQFEQKAKLFSRQRLGTCKDVSPLAVETLFWRAAADKHISVEYANDIPGSAFAEPVDSSSSLRGKKRKRGTDEADQGLGTGFRGDESLPFDESTGADEELDGYDTMRLATGSAEGVGESGGTAGSKLANSAWNMRNVARSQGSLLRFMPDEVPGVTSPMVYIGMLFSWFAWHVEDHELHSLNYLHTGAPKTWYAVPGDAAPALEEAVRVHGYGGQLSARAAFSLLGEKTTVMSPEVLVAAGVPCCRLVQNAGEYVVTFPRAYHLGFSHGFNCGEAANFATPGWLDVAKDAAARRAAMNYLPMLSHQQLLYLLTMSLPPRMPSSSPSEPRSSRLKVRKKSPGEEMVKNIFVNDVIHNNRLLRLLLDKGVPCCLLAKDAVNHAVVSIRPLERSEQILRATNRSLPTGGFQQQVVDTMHHEVASRVLSLVTQAEDTNGGMQVPAAKLADSTLEIFPSKHVTSIEAGTKDGMGKIVDLCISSELPGTDGVNPESKAAPHGGESTGSTSTLAIDWGILPCAACGILCYATMAVVEPTSTASSTFKSLPVKPIHLATGSSKDRGAGTESVGFAADSPASTSQNLNLSNQKIVSSRQPDYTDVGGEHGCGSGVPVLVDEKGVPVAEVKQLVVFGDELPKMNPCVENSEPYIIDFAKGNPQDKSAYAKTTALATDGPQNEHVPTSEVSQHLKTEPGNIEMSTVLGTLRHVTISEEIRDAGEKIDNCPEKSHNATVRGPNVKEDILKIYCDASPKLETGTPPLLKSSNVLSSLQLLSSTYDEDTSDMDVEDILDGKTEDCEEEETCQVSARPDSVTGYLFTDLIGLSSDVSWRCLNLTVLDIRRPPLITLSSPAYSFQSLVDGPTSLQAVFTSGGFAFVEDDRLVDRETLERLLNEQKESAKDATADGCLESSECCGDTSGGLEEEKVDDMQELYRRINSQALNDEGEDDDLALISFENSRDIESWQPESGSINTAIAEAVPQRQAETPNSRFNANNLKASYYELGSGEDMLAARAASVTPSSMATRGLDCSVSEISYNARHAALDNCASSKSDEKIFSGKFGPRMFDASNKLIVGHAAYYRALPSSRLQVGRNASVLNEQDIICSNARDLNESTPRTCSSLGREACPADQHVGRGGSKGIGAEKDVSVALTGVRQRARGSVGRPRVLCLEHAVEAQKRLQDIGGAHILIVCHSGFQDYELRAKEIAQELGIEYAWRDISFSKGSEDEIELVKMAVEVEENDNHGYTDWISQLGMLVHPRFTTKESEAFDSFKKVSGAFRAGPFKKAKPGRPPGSGLMAGRLGISRKRADDTKIRNSNRTAADIEGQLKGSKKKKCMVAGRWCGKVWRVNQVHPMLGGCRSLDLPPQTGTTLASLNTSSLAVEAVRVGFTKGPPVVDGSLSPVAADMEDQQTAAAKRRSRQRKLLEHAKEPNSDDSSLGPLRILSVSRSSERKISEDGEDQMSESLSGGPLRNTGLDSRKEWKLLEQAKDQGSEDSSVGALKIQLFATSQKISGVADSEVGQYASILPHKSQCKSKDSIDELENVDNKEKCAPLDEVELARYPDHISEDGVVQSFGCMTQPMPLAAYDPLTTDEKNKCSKFVFDPTSPGAGDSAVNEFSGDVISREGDCSNLPSASTHALAQSRCGWQVLSELRQDAMGKQNEDPPDLPRVHSLNESPIPVGDAVGPISTEVETRVRIIQGSSDPGSLLCFGQNLAKDGGTRAQRPGMGSAVWCDVPIASSPSWTAGGSASARSDQPVHPLSNLHPSHSGHQMYFASRSDHVEDTVCDMSHNAARPVKGRFLQKHGPEDPTSPEIPETALKMRNMLDFERPQAKRSPTEVISSEEPVNDVDSITTSNLLGWKRKTDGGANTSGKKAKSSDNGKNVKFQEGSGTLDPNSDNVVALFDGEVHRGQELCESSHHPENELEQFDCEDDGSQHTLRDIKYVYGVSDCRGEYLAQTEGFVGEDISGDLPAEQTAEDQDSCLPVTMLESQTHDRGSQKMQKSRVPVSQTPPQDVVRQCAPGLHPLDLLSLMTTNPGKPLGKTRGKRSKHLKQIWGSLKHPLSDGSIPERSDGKREGQYDSRVDVSEVHELQAVQCVEARFEAEDCDRGLEIADHSGGRTIGSSSRLRARGPPVEEPDSEEDGEEPNMTPEKTKKKGRPKKKKLVGRMPKDDEDKEFQCDLDGCRMSFATEAELSIHKKNRCTFKGCNKRFFMHKYLLQHRRVHQPDRPLKCPWVGCTQSFKWAWARTEHIRVHTGERPYTCPDCEQTFRFVSDFSRHKRNTGHTKV